MLKYLKAKISWVKRNIRQNQLFVYFQLFVYKTKLKKLENSYAEIGHLKLNLILHKW